MYKTVLLSLGLISSVFSASKLVANNVSNKTVIVKNEDGEIALWSGFRDSACSFTFDDGPASNYEYVAPILEKYGYRGTFNLVTNWNPNWSEFKKMAKNGHEIGSHSNSHGQNMTGEEKSSKENIIKKLDGEIPVYTVAYPNCTVPNETTVNENYVCGRIGNGSWQGVPDINSKDGPSNWTKVSALMTGSTGINTVDAFKNQFQSAINVNGWVCFLTHGIVGKNNGSATYSPTDPNAIEGALSWLKQNDTKVWVAPMGEVAQYIKERNASKLSLSTTNDDSVTYTLTHSIADSVSDYKYPLSVRVPLPENWENVSVTQNNAVINSSIVDGKIYFDAVPNGGDIIISKVIVPVPCTEITMKKTSTIIKGKNERLSVTLTPANTTDDVKWTSSNEEVAKADEYGLVTTYKTGTATITATAGSVSCSCDVSIIEDSVISILMLSNPTKTSYYIGEDLDLSGAVISVKMESGDNKDIDVTAEMISGYDKTKEGKQSVTVAYNGKNAYFEVTVTKKNSSLSAGAIAGIISGSLIDLAALGFLLFILIKRKKKNAK